MANSIFLACKRCRVKKLKCDDTPVSCRSCHRSKSDCINIDIRTGREYSRSYADELRDRASRLSAALESASRSSTERIEGSQASNSPSHLSHLAYHGEGSVVSVARLVEAGVTARTGDSPLYSMGEETHRQHAEQSQVEAVPAPHPSFEVASQLLESYLTGPHLLHPFLLRSTLLRDLKDLYSPEVSMSGLARFRIHMVFAVGAVSLHRRGQHSIPPINYYARAKQWVDDALGFGGLEHVQSLLQLVIFSVHDANGIGNMWDLTRISMRICIENRYHKKSSMKLKPIEDQLRRRVFWTSYICDRHSSSMLGRPLAIEEDEIEVEMPFDADDDLVEACSIEEQDLRGLSETSIQRRHIQLRRITTKIRTDLYRRRPSSSNDMDGLEARTAKVLDELDNWRLAIPGLGVCRSVYETDQWRDLNYYRERLKCVRALIQPDRIAQVTGSQLESHLDDCLKASMGITRCYQELRASDRLVMNWSCVHDIMSAGFSVLYCGLTWYDSVRSRQQWEQQSCPALIEEAIRACVDMLAYISEEWRVVGKHLGVFRTLASRVLGLLGQQQPQHAFHQPSSLLVPPALGAPGLEPAGGSEFQALGAEEVGEANIELWASERGNMAGGLSEVLMGPVSEAFTIDGMDWQDFDWTNFDWQAILSTG